MKKPCHICGEKFDLKELGWYNSEGSHTPYKIGDWDRKENRQTYLKSEFTIFLCPGCESAHNTEEIRGGLNFVTWAWQYDVTGKVPAVYYDINYRTTQGAIATRRVRLEVAPDFTPDDLLEEFTTLYEARLTFGQLSMVLPPKSLQFFKRKIKGRLKRLQKQWKDREKIREKKDNQRKDKVQEIARGYAEIPRDVIPALVRMSGKSPDELRKIAGFIECLAGRKYWQDQAMHREAAELSKVLSVMEA